MAAGRVLMNEPACLIETDRDGKLSVVRSSLAILEQIDQPVVVVGVVGLYRTGKSYLMNRLAGKHRGFALGAAVQSKTKGIWMWCVPHPRKAELTLVLLDTEGLGDVEKGDESNDNWIFAMAVLLSSTLVYNSMGTIDNNALEKLHYVSELTEHIKIKSNTDEDDDLEYVRYFPSFVWTVRDFTLKLELDEKPITANEYLENSLKLRTGSSKKVQQFNAPRSCLRNYFSPRWCFVFERPANGQLMKRMEELTDADLEPAFVQQAREFTEHIYTTSETKTLRGGFKVTGRLLGNLAVTYVEAIRSGQIPCLDNAVVALAEIENSKAVERARALYAGNMAAFKGLPTDTQEQLSAIHAQCETEALALFMKLAFRDEDQKHQKKLAEVLDGEYKQMCEKNCQESVKACERIIKRVFQPLEDRLSSNYYTTRGGHKKFCEDLQAMTEGYKCAKGRGVKTEVVLKAYLDEKATLGRTILAADESLTEADRRAEEGKAKRQEAERERQVLAERLHAQERLAADQLRTNELNVSQLMEKMESHRRDTKAEHDRMMKDKDQEMQKLQDKRMEEEAARLQEQIDALKEVRQVEQKEEQSVWSQICDGVGSVLMFVPHPYAMAGGLALKGGSRML